MPSSALGFWRGVRRIEVLGVRLGPAMGSRCSAFHQRLNLLGRSNLFLGVVQPQELVNSDSPQNDPFPCRPRLHHLGSRNDFGPLQLVRVPFPGNCAGPRGHHIAAPVGLAAVDQRQDETITVGICTQRRLIGPPAATPDVGEDRGG
jgi:hypothetical protein